MNHFVRNFGGKLVLDVLETSCPPFANADYWFEQENVIVELKCLSEDKSGDPRIKAAINKLLNDSINSGRMPDPGPGRFLVSSANCPTDVQKALYKILAKPIRRRLHKANRQIKATRERLGRRDAHGLVLLANDGNYRLEPDQLLHAVDVALGKDFSGIESVIVFTVNMLANTPLTNYHTCIWLPASRDGHRKLSKEFLDRFQTGWTRHVGKLIGENIPVLQDIEHAALSSFRYDQAVSKAMK